MAAGEEYKPVIRTGPRTQREGSQNRKRTRMPVTGANTNNLVIC